MTTPNPINDPDAMIAAFADGELDGEQNLTMLRRVAEDPALAQRVADQHKLRDAVAKSMSDPAKAPSDLRDRIAQLAQTTPADEAPTTSYDRRNDSPVLARIGRWVPAAVAAVLLIGALVALNLVNNNSTPARPTANLITASNALNTQLVDKFGDRHAKCSRNLSTIHGTEQFPQDLAQLPGALSDYMHHTVDPQVLDLTPLGFEFEVAGICILPGKGSVHLIYNLPKPDGGVDALSFWIRPYEEGSGIEPDHLYTTHPDQQTYPMIVWRHADMVYYLVGDSYDAVERAFRAVSQNPG